MKHMTIIFILLICGCKPTSNNNNFKNSDSSYTKRQLALNNKNYIYNYRDTLILYKDINESVKNRIILNGDLGQDGNIGEWINDDTLTIYVTSINDNLQPKDTFPVSITYQKNYDIVLKRIKYQVNAYTSDHYYFDSLSTNSKSITFYNLNGHHHNVSFLL